MKWCNSCGTVPDDQLMMYVNGRWYCAPCGEALETINRAIKKQQQAMHIDHNGTRNLICPYCGNEELDSWECKHDSDEYQCKSCGEFFEYEREVLVSFTTWKKTESEDTK